MMRWLHIQGASHSTNRNRHLGSALTRASCIIYLKKLPCLPNFLKDVLVALFSNGTEEALIGESAQIASLQPSHLYRVVSFGLNSRAHPQLLTNDMDEFIDGPRILKACDKCKARKVRCSGPFSCYCLYVP